MTREPEFDDYTRARVLALMAWEAKRCPTCQNYDCLVPLGSDLRLVTWDNHGGRQYEVAQYRCLACGAADIIRRDWFTAHEKDEAETGRFIPADGRMFIARPAEETT